MIYDSKIKMNKKIYKLILSLLIIWFLYQTVFLATNLKPSIIPDEPYHIEFIKIYRDKFSPIINKQEGHFNLGDITRAPSYFYHYLLGMISKLFRLDINFTTYLRLINVSFSLLTLIIFIKTLDFLTKNKYTKISSIIMLSNTLMFTVLSGGVNYDNLLNLLSIIDIYLFIKFIKEEKIETYILFLIFSLLASIVKISFLPIFIILNLAMFIKICKIHKFKERFTEQINNANKYILIAVFTLLIVSFTLFIERYISNLVKFGTLAPICTQIHSTENCLLNPQYKSATSYELKNLKPNLHNLIMNFSKWLSEVLNTTFGFFGHKSISANQLFIYIFNFIILISYSFFIRYTKYKKDKFNYFLIFLSLFYILFIFIYINYRDYLKYEFLGFALQGRYIFPVIPIIFYLINNFIIRNININFLKVLYVSFILVIFVKFSFFWFIEQTNSEWFRNEKSNYFIVNLDK